MEWRFLKNTKHRTHVWSRNSKGFHTYTTMLTDALFTARKQIHPRWPLIDEQVIKMSYIYTTEFLFIYKKWNYENVGKMGGTKIFLNEIIKTWEDKCHMFFLLWQILTSNFHYFSFKAKKRLILSNCSSSFNKPKFSVIKQYNSGS